MRELSASFGLAMFTGVLCIYIVAGVLFKDFMQPAPSVGVDPVIPAVPVCS